MSEELDYDFSKIDADIEALREGGYRVTIRKPRDYPHTSIWTYGFAYNNRLHSDKRFSAANILSANIKAFWYTQKARRELQSYVRNIKKADRFNERRSQKSGSN